MLLAVDVQYKDDRACVAGVAFDDWHAELPTAVYQAEVSPVADYQAGEFYKRELSCILALLEKYRLSPSVIVIDGFVFLDGKQSPGLGKYLYDALDQQVAVIGVAKNPYTGIPAEYELQRGDSQRPLYVTCVGMTLAEARGHILSMHGNFRIPTLLKQADIVCRQS